MKHFPLIVEVWIRVLNFLTTKKWFFDFLFWFESLDPIKGKWTKHPAIQKLSEVLNLVNTCGYVTFVSTGVPDLGCDDYDIDVHLIKPKSRKERKDSTTLSLDLSSEHSSIGSSTAIKRPIVRFNFNKNCFFSFLVFNFSFYFN